MLSLIIILFLFIAWHLKPSLLRKNLLKLLIHNAKHFKIISKRKENY
jgi:hypothetical protein